MTRHTLLRDAPQPPLTLLLYLAERRLRAAIRCLDHATRAGDADAAALQLDALARAREQVRLAGLAFNAAAGITPPATTEKV